MPALDHLERRHLVHVRDEELALLADAEDIVSESIEAGIHLQLELLQSTARELICALAVWGGPASIATLAELTGTGPASVTGPVRLAAEVGVVRWTPAGVEFIHDPHRDLVLADLDAPTAHTLHSAAAATLASRGAPPLTVARQTARAAAPEAVHRLGSAATELAHAPLHAADLLAEAAAHVVPGSTDADELAVQRAGSLAVAGRVTTAGVTSSCNSQ